MTSSTPLESEPRARFRRRHPFLTTLIVLCIVVPLVGIGVYAWHLNSQLGKIEKVSTDSLDDRPDPAPGQALNVLIIGSDRGEEIDGSASTTTLAQDARRSEWPRGKYRSDTIMVAHISSDRDEVYLASIPRDSFVMIYDDEGQPTAEAKINSAFTDHGPIGTIATVENLTGLRMNHLAIIDWEGFRDLSRAVDGVPVSIPTTFYDPSQKITWEAGDHVLEGEQALAYVRTRYGLADGDFDRIKRQQNFLRALMGKMLDSGVTSNPVRLSNTVGALAENLTLDEDMTNDTIRGLALSLRGLETEDVVFLTTPKERYDTDPRWGSIVRLDREATAQLFDAIRTESVEQFIADHPDTVLPDSSEVK